MYECMYICMHLFIYLFFYLFAANLTPFKIRKVDSMYNKFHESQDVIQQYMSCNIHGVPYN